MDIIHTTQTVSERARLARISRRLWAKRYGINTRDFHLNRRRQDISFRILLVVAATLTGLLVFA